MCDYAYYGDNKQYAHQTGERMLTAGDLPTLMIAGDALEIEGNQPLDATTRPVTEDNLGFLETWLFTHSRIVAEGWNFTYAHYKYMSAHFNSHGHRGSTGIAGSCQTNHRVRDRRVIGTWERECAMNHRLFLDGHVEAYTPGQVRYISGSTTGWQYCCLWWMY